MTNQDSIQIEIANILRSIGTQKCFKKAEILEQESSSTNSLHLRDLALDSSHIASIANCLKQAANQKHLFIKSISFSYNPLFGDAGAIALTKNLPKSICEIGLVNCGISDVGGNELLSWMRRSKSLQMVCVEQNNFSKKLRLEFGIFNAAHPDILVVY